MNHAADDEDFQANRARECDVVTLPIFQKTEVIVVQIAAHCPFSERAPV